MSRINQFDLKALFPCIPLEITSEVYELASFGVGLGPCVINPKKNEKIK